jgi:hypothetical protein
VLVDDVDDVDEVGGAVVAGVPDGVVVQAAITAATTPTTSVAHATRRGRNRSTLTEC